MPVIMTSLRSAYSGGVKIFEVTAMLRTRTKYLLVLLAPFAVSCSHIDVYDLSKNNSNSAYIIEQKATSQTARVASPIYVDWEYIPEKKISEERQVKVDPGLRYIAFHYGGIYYANGYFEINLKEGKSYRAEAEERLENVEFTLYEEGNDKPLDKYYGHWHKQLKGGFYR